MTADVIQFPGLAVGDVVHIDGQPGQWRVVGLNRGEHGDHAQLRPLDPPRPLLVPVSKLRKVPTP